MLMINNDSGKETLSKNEQNLEKNKENEMIIQSIVLNHF